MGGALAVARADSDDVKLSSDEGDDDVETVMVVDGDVDDELHAVWVALLVPEAHVLTVADTHEEGELVMLTVGDIVT